MNQITAKEKPMDHDEARDLMEGTTVPPPPEHAPDPEEAPNPFNTGPDAE